MTGVNALTCKDRSDTDAHAADAERKVQAGQHGHPDPEDPADGWADLDQRTFKASLFEQWRCAGKSKRPDQGGNHNWIQRCD